MDEQIIDELKTEIKNKYFLFYIVAAVLLLITWFFKGTPVTFKVLSIFLFVVSQFVYNIKIKTPDDIFYRFLKRMLFVLSLLFAITYLASSVEEIEIALITLLIIPFAVLIGLFIPMVFSLWEGKSIWDVIISYISLVFIVIVLFGFTFTILSAFEGNEVKWASGDTAVRDFWDFIYFSAQIFYSNNFGDIVPLGLSRLLAVVELVLSAIFHIIVLGMIITRLSEKIKK